MTRRRRLLNWLQILAINAMSKKEPRD